MTNEFGGLAPSQDHDETVERPTPHVPLAALHAERGRRQAAERERDDLLAQLKGQSEPEAPGMDEDEADEVAWPADGPETDVATEPDEDIDVGADLEALNEHLNASAAMARSSFGDAAVDAAEAWAERAMRQDPALAAEVLSHPNPYAFALGFALSAQEARPAAPASGPMLRPRSLAGAPSAGGAAHVPTGPGQAYDSLFSG